MRRTLSFCNGSPVPPAGDAARRGSPRGLALDPVENAVNLAAEPTDAPALGVPLVPAVAATPVWSRSRTVLVLLAASLAFATSGPFGRLAAPASPVLIAAFRTTVAAAVLFSLRPAATVRAVRALRPLDAANVFAAGAVLALHLALFLWGLRETSLPSAVTLVSLEPVAVVLAAWLFLRIRPSRTELLGVGIATLGAVVVAAFGGEAGGEHRLFGDVLVLLAVCLYGVYITLARRIGDALDARSYATSVYAAASITLGLVCLWQRPTLALPTHSYVYLLLLAVVPTLFGHTLVQTAARTLPPSVIALVSPGETVGALLISGLFLHAPPRAHEALGAAIVLAGVLVTVSTAAAGASGASSSPPPAHGTPPSTDGADVVLAPPPDAVP